MGKKDYCFDDRFVKQHGNRSMNMEAMQDHIVNGAMLVFSRASNYH